MGNMHAPTSMTAADRERAHQVALRLLLVEEAYDQAELARVATNLVGRTQTIRSARDWAATVAQVMAAQ